MQFMSVSRTEAEKGFIVVAATDVAAEIIPGTLNSAVGGLHPGQVVEWVTTTTAALQGYRVEIVDGVYNRTQGIAGKVAGVVDTTIATGAVGRLQVYGPANVRASASYDAPAALVTWSINATNVGHVTNVSVNDTLGSVAHLGAFVGWSLEAGPNATNATVHLSLL